MAQRAKEFLRSEAKRSKNQVYNIPLSCIGLFVFLPFFLHTAVKGVRAKIGPARERVLAKRSEARTKFTTFPSLGLFLPFFPHTAVRAVRAKIGPAFIQVYTVFLPHNCNYSTSSVSSSATDYQHSRRAVLAWAVGPCGLVLEGLKHSSRR